MTVQSNDMHLFYIPVMGTGFSTETPMRVAQYGITSVISLVDDVLLEQIRKHLTNQAGEPYEPITDEDSDPRANRITAFLNMVNARVQKQVAELKAEPFTSGSRITRYFELLPENDSKRLYHSMLAEKDPDKKTGLQDRLREIVAPGAIDANIMTKVNRTNYRGNKPLPPEYADALAALRGFANSDLNSSIVFSAGLNQRLCTYLTSFDDFFPDNGGNLRKKVVLKVSDFRSAGIQGKFLARRGIWVSEFRMESGLNCGGHAFPTNGNMMGPILEQFKRHRNEMVANLFKVYNKALAGCGRPVYDSCPPVKFTAQGGIGTKDEFDLMLEHYELNATGWGTPFLLVPEVTSLDPVHLQRICDATEDDVFLSKSSPLGIPFWNLRTSDSEAARLQRIAEDKPGSACPKGYAVTNTEFTDLPICIASRTYQKAKLKSIHSNDATSEQLPVMLDDVLSKSCICHDLSGSIKLKNGIESDATPAICCGPNIAYFSKVTTLEKMLDHIYGRGEQLFSPGRPHMFVQELRLYVDYLRKELERFALNLSSQPKSYFAEFKSNLLEALEYYQSRAEKLVKTDLGPFLDDLKAICHSIEQLKLEPVTS
ncbi:MAG: hypothetical protein FVQ81_11300 [Candidatus Glassbacteria bacterium]|nr:hypothetical protein [Candidatus Glassbacteria bacterium]